MANWFNLILDTTAPSNPTISIESGATFATAQLVNLTIGTSDSPTTGYQMKIWGDVDGTYDANVKTTEGTSSWISFATTKQVKLSSAEGTKTIYLKIRDDVYNESAQVSDTITLDMSLPIVSVSAVDVSKVSKIAGKNTATFTFSADVVITEYKVKYVTSSGATHDTGTLIGTSNGSVNTSGTGSFNTSVTPISVQIKGSDLELASSGDGQKIIKVFAKDEAGQWSV